MYLLFGICFALCVICLCLGFYRKKCIIRKICQMDDCQKLCLLNKILHPFGFCYQAQQDIVTTTADAWQRQFGYRSLFDKTASRFGMVFDCEPVFFYYKGRTYRIELWKGQYGINLGGEAGIYYADGMLTPEQFDTAVFQSVPDEELPVIALTLYRSGQKLFESSRLHWWLAGFCVGKYSEPENLTMKVSITFRDSGMSVRFAESLRSIGYPACDIVICDTTISFVFSRPYTRQTGRSGRLRIRYTMWKNRMFCKLFLYVTRHFFCTPDRILYLYFFLPAAFRHMFLCKKNRRQKCHKKKKVVRLSGI